MHSCAMPGALDECFASSIAQHCANAKPSMCPGAEFRAALPPISQKVLRLGYDKKEHRLSLQRKKQAVGNVLCRDQPCSLRSALLSQLLACCWTQRCAKAQPGPGVPMGLH